MSEALHRIRSGIPTAGAVVLATSLVLPPSPASLPPLHFSRLTSVAGSWRAVLDLAGAPLPFSITIEGPAGGWRGRLCNGERCEPVSGVRVTGDSVVLEIADYAASIGAERRGDSLVGVYRNVGNRGPRVIPFRAARGRWEPGPGPAALVGRWDATFYQDWRTSPRVLELRNGASGLEGTIVSNSGDYGYFSGRATQDSFALAHFDGSFVYLLTGRLDGDTLRGVLHAGLRTQTRWTAVRSTGAPFRSSSTRGLVRQSW